MSQATSWGGDENFRQSHLLVWWYSQIQGTPDWGSRVAVHGRASWRASSGAWETAREREKERERRGRSGGICFCITPSGSTTMASLKHIPSSGWPLSFTYIPLAFLSHYQGREWLLLMCLLDIHVCASADSSLSVLLKVVLYRVPWQRQCGDRRRGEGLGTLKQ